MDNLEPSVLQAVGGVLTLIILFVLRELVSGALKEAGKELWLWTRTRRNGKCQCRDQKSRTR